MRCSFSVFTIFLRNSASFSWLHKCSSSSTVLQGSSSSSVTSDLVDVFGWVVACNMDSIAFFMSASIWSNLRRTLLSKFSNSFGISVPLKKEHVCEYYYFLQPKAVLIMFFQFLGTLNPLVGWVWGSGWMGPWRNFSWDGGNCGYISYGAR